MGMMLLAALAFTVALGSTWLLSRSDIQLNPLDRPNVRSLHDHPMPRTGGLALLASLGITVPPAWVYFGPNGGLGLPALGVALLGVVSYADDRWVLPPWSRLIAHFAAASLLIPGGFAMQQVQLPVMGALPLGVLGIPLTVLFVVWCINLYNFMDGMDGFAGGMGVIGFTIVALLAHRGGHGALAVIALLVVAANLGFLAFNFPPARIFMGDAGSIPMGFLVAWTALWGVRDRLFPLWVPVLIFSPFIVDATATLIRRMWRGEPFWHAHCSHYYQRLVLHGWGHRKTVLGEYGLMGAVGCTAFFLHPVWYGVAALAALAAWALAFAVLAWLVDHFVCGEGNS